jgi:hypothetical protein
LGSEDSSRKNAANLSKKYAKSVASASKETMMQE